MEAFFDFIAPAAVDVVAFVERFWPSLLVIAAAWWLARSGGRAPQLAPPPPRIAYALICLLSLATSALTFAWRGAPMMPEYEDDFGYLLAADTFLHGRLTNPPHPLAAHFDSIYALQHPTYSAIYLPGNGLVLALGRLIAGKAIVGMWIAAALAAVAIFWALRGWISDGWAFALGCLVAVHPTMAAWSDSYHGGALSACGGALVAGAAARMRREARIVHGFAFGAGALLLELTRPYEGLVVAAAFALIALYGARTSGPLSLDLRSGDHSALDRSPDVDVRRLRTGGPRSVLLAALSIAAAGVAFVMVIDYRVTGDALKLPYVAYNERHLSAPNFIWQRAGPIPQQEHPEFVRLYRQFRRYYFENREPRQFLKTAYAETVALGHAAIPDGRSFWLLELIPLGAFVVAACRNRNAAAIAAVVGAAYLSLLAITWFTQPHYAAPACAAFAIAVGIGLMTLRPWLARAAFLAMLAAALTATISSWRPNGVSHRTRMAEAIVKTPGPHLVLVPESCNGMIFNGAEIDRQRIIWARDLGANDALLARYADRTVWRVRCEGGFGVVPVRAPLRPSSVKSYESYPQM